MALVPYQGPDNSDNATNFDHYWDGFLDALEMAGVHFIGDDMGPQIGSRDGDVSNGSNAGVQGSSGSQRAGGSDSIGSLPGGIENVCGNSDTVTVNT